MKPLVVVGDVMVDHYHLGSWGKVVSEVRSNDRLRVFVESRPQYQCGGAANAAAILASLSPGDFVALYGVVGRDAMGDWLKSRWPYLTVRADATTTVKHRWMVEDSGTVVFRTDAEKPLELREANPESVVDLARVKHASGVLISDYGKGVVTFELAQAVIAAASARGIPVVVDPKGRCWERFAGATLITPNEDEIEAAIDGQSLGRQEALSYLAGLTGAALLCTHGARGMTLHRLGHADLHIPAHQVRHAFPIGAGDAVAAAALLKLAHGRPWVEAVEFANAAAAAACSRPGTFAPPLTEALSYLHGRGGDDSHGQEEAKAERSEA